MLAKEARFAACILRAVSYYRAARAGYKVRELRAKPGSFRREARRRGGV